MVRQYYEQGAHVLLVDTGNSCLGLSQLIHNRTRGEDGIYFTYTKENPIAFDPFYVEDGVCDIEKKESIKTLILTLWKDVYKRQAVNKEMIALYWEVGKRITEQQTALGWGKDVYKRQRKENW